jgi:anti-sigma factor RsiW
MRAATSPLTTRSLLEYLEGEVTRSQRDAIERRLAADPAARGLLDELRAMVGALQAPDAALEGEDLVPALRRRIAAAPPRAPVPRPRRAWVVAGALASAAALAGAIGVGLATRPTRKPAAAPGELRPKAAAAAPSPEQWVALEVYHLGEGGAPARLGARLPAGDGLLCGYANLGREPFSHLAVFAVDGRGEVFWLYPAADDAATDAGSIPIQPGVRQPLPDLVHHQLRTGPLAIYGLFTRAPVRSRAVEGAIRDLVREARWDAAAPSRLPFAGSAQVRIQTTVAP